MWEEELLKECRNLLLSVVLQVDIDDAWRWDPDPIAGYMASGAYHILTNRPLIIGQVPATLLWRKDVPLKVSIFTWRLFRYRLPTKSNLFHIGIIPAESQLCVSGCGSHESENHLFFVLPSVWYGLAASSELVVRVYS